MGEVALVWQRLFLSAMYGGICITYLYPLKHQSQFIKRLVLSILTGLLGFYLLSANPVLGGGLNQLFYLILTVGVLLICCDISWHSCLYCSVWIVITFQAAAEIWLVFCNIIYLQGLSLSISWLAGFLLFSGVVAGVGLTIARWMPQNGEYHVGPRQLTLALLLFGLLEGIVFLLNRGGNKGNIYDIVIVVIRFYCITMLYLQQALFRKSAMQQELDILNCLQYEQRQQYTIAKDTIALINRKCHDLKHQVAAMRHISENEEKERYLQEIEDSVRIYQAIVQTGNEVLDTVLTEKSLFCEANKITVHCVADGESLSFMAPVDIYVIMGNSLDNAIENVQKLTQPEKRFIDVLISKERHFLVIQIINPLDGKLVFEGDLPKSTKPHDGYHGFGLKSIRHTLKKYHGRLLVEEKNSCFCLKMVIPIPDVILASV